MKTHSESLETNAAFAAASVLMDSVQAAGFELNPTCRRVSRS